MMSDKNPTVAVIDAVTEGTMLKKVFVRFSAELACALIGDRVPAFKETRGEISRRARLTRDVAEMSRHLNEDFDV